MEAQRHALGTFVRLMSLPPGPRVLYRLPMKWALNGCSKPDWEEEEEGEEGKESEEQGARGVSHKWAGN